MNQRQDVAALKPTELKKILARVPLPAMPDCAMRMLEITGEGDNDTHRCTELIESDAGMAAQLLKFSNSSYFGLRHKISSVQQAITLLGFRKVRNFVLWNAVFSVMPDPGRRTFSMVAFRCDALRRGLFARALAKRLGLKDAEDVFTAALLQDVSVPLLLQHFGEDYLALLDHRDEGDAKLAEREQETFGWTHADAACLLFKKWRLPKVLAELVSTHSDPVSLLQQGGAGPDAQAVAVSSLLPGVRDKAWPRVESFKSCWESLALAHSSTLPDFLVEVDESFEALAHVLNAGANSASLASLYWDATVGCNT